MSFSLKSSGIGAGLGGILFGITVPSRLAARDNAMEYIKDAMTTASRIATRAIIVKDCVLIQVQK